MYIGVQLNIFMPAQTADTTVLHEQNKELMKSFFNKQICKSDWAKCTAILKLFVPENFNFSWT